MKTILIIGTGKFGHHLCHRLVAMQNEVMIVDNNEEHIRDLFTQVTSARVGDCTNPDVLKSLGIGNFDIIIVCIAENFQNSLEVTSLVKELGGKYVISTASRDIQAKFLLKNGADEVIYPDRDIAYNLAMKCSADHVFDFVELTDEYSIYEVPIVKEWVGKTIREINVRANYNVNIIGIVSGGETIIMPSADYSFASGDHIKVISDQNSLKKLVKRI
ncbi:MAG: TrkA family potassium uptake protein [Eubacteriales bacterium]|nr:TrkA family potassium uptake protein [Eubacteriales bacterium]